MGAVVAWCFRAMPASNSTSPVSIGLSEDWVAEDEVGVVVLLTDGLPGLASPRVREGGL